MKEVKNRFGNLGAEEITPPETQNLLTQAKVKRDTFTFPESDYQKLVTLKKQCLRAGVEVTKSEIIRAGLHALEKLTEIQLIETVKGVEKIKTGKPKQDK